MIERPRDDLHRCAPAQRERRVGVPEVVRGDVWQVFARPHQRRQYLDFVPRRPVDRPPALFPLRRVRPPEERRERAVQDLWAGPGADLRGEDRAGFLPEEVRFSRSS